MARRFSLSSLLPQRSEDPGVCGESTHFYVHATLLKLCHVRAYFYAQAHGHFLGALICVRGDDDLAVDLSASMARVKLHFAIEKIGIRSIQGGLDFHYYHLAILDHYIEFHLLRMAKDLPAASQVRKRSAVKPTSRRIVRIPC